MLFFNSKDEATKQLEQIILGIMDKVPHERRISYQVIGKLLDQIHAKKSEDAYFAPFISIIKNKAGDYPAQIMTYLTQHITEYPYSVGYLRRPFRTKNPRVHLESMVRKLFALYDFSKTNFSLTEYLATPVNIPDTSMAAYYLAYELDQNNRHVFDSLKEILFGDNNTALLNRAMIRGIFLSHQAEAYHMLGQMLIAARLQEGLRQSIVESMDEGTIEAFTYLMKVIIDHDLIRYSSVIRALDVWTGLVLEAANTRVVKQCMDYAYACLSDDNLCQEWEQHNDVHKLYFSLWARAVKEEDGLQYPLRHIMEHGATYQKITAQYFLMQSQNDELRVSLSMPYLHESDLELQARIIANYVYQWSSVWRSHAEYEALKNKPVIERVPLLENKTERIRQFELFKTMLLHMPKHEVTEKSKVFDWMTYSHSTDHIANKMLYLAAYDLDPDLILQVLALKDQVSPDLRNSLIRFFTSDVANPVQRQFLFDSLSDKSMTNREAALKRINDLSLTQQDADMVQGLLKLKTGAIRQSAIQILLKQDVEQLDQSIETLLDSQVELQRVGALEMLCELKEDEQRASHFERVQHHIASIKEPSDKELFLVDRLKQKEAKGLHNGFGLFDPNKKQELHPLPDYSNVRVKDFFDLPIEKITSFLQGLSDLVHVHRDYEYTSERYEGGKENFLLGARLERLKGYQKQEHEKTHLEGYPLAEIWERYLRESRFTARELIQFHFYFVAESIYKYDTDKLASWEASRYKSLGDWVKKFVSDQYPMETIHAFYAFFSKLPYMQQVRQLVFAFSDDSDRVERFSITSTILNRMIDALQEQGLEEKSKAWATLTSPWRSWAENSVYDDPSFLAYFAMKHNLDQLTDFEEFHVDLQRFVRARDLGLIDDDEIYKELMIRNRRSSQNVRTITNKRLDFVKAHPMMQRYKEHVLSVILELELNRGDLPTDVSGIAMSVAYYEGMAYFISILSALNQESFVRGYIYGNHSKKEALSGLLRVCHPKEGDDVQKLKMMLQGKNISEKRLLEAAMYAPQWLELVSEYLNWNGLRSAAWYFHAHVNEHFSAEKETIVAHYSPISSVDFNDGAFDISWFMDAYEELGEKRFAVLYQCAKYISAGANHRRSQLFADAVLGKLNLDEVRATVEAKRNKDQLLSYSLIPIGDDHERDVLERYEYIQQFLTESKKFGSQRSASEAKAAAIALDNLSRNAGYQDVIRLKWDMEARKIADILHLLEPMAIDEFEVRIIIDETGRADIEAVKQGKVLKSLPSKINKHPYVVSLKETVSSLRAQYKRAKSEFEKCMESESSFTYQELSNLMKNPTLAPLLKSLVFKAGDRLGFHHEGQLVSASGEMIPLSMEDVLYIAHPLHLYHSGEWSLYQKYLFDRQLKQPFKQIFRELYLPNKDELEHGSSSRRYAGHQIQPKRTVALLKTRLWTVSYEEGLQKVYHKENIIAQVYALADWFSPSDIEAPTLETISFMDRKTYKPLELSSIPGIIFSEIMRDIDLVVSTAHVGGVDPESSLTTIELRKVIVAESLRLLKISNVRLEGNFARIAGSLGDYGVHLGSGTVQKQAAGTLYILPVHSQHRGKLFLPFMDEDPKTSEILSKIVMLAQDTKIKDPSILDQLRDVQNA